MAYGHPAGLVIRKKQDQLDFFSEDCILDMAASGSGIRVFSTVCEILSKVCLYATYISRQLRKQL